MRYRAVHSRRFRKRCRVVHSAFQFFPDWFFDILILRANAGRTTEQRALRPVCAPSKNLFERIARTGPEAPARSSARKSISATDGFKESRFAIPLSKTLGGHVSKSLRPTTVPRSTDSLIAKYRVSPR